MATQPPAPPAWRGPCHVLTSGATSQKHYFTEGTLRRRWGGPRGGEGGVPDACLSRPRVASLPSASLPPGRLPGPRARPACVVTRVLLSQAGHKRGRAALRSSPDRWSDSSEVSPPGLSETVVGVFQRVINFKSINETF